MEQTKRQRGRPFMAPEDRRKHQAFRLPIWMVEQIESQPGSKTAVVERSLIEYFARMKKAG